eukprot:TRINITY_DN8187_c0_g1_i20.p1 TRINITY_DN8187_c0_g1~~TRINITY_DN8187_c0_g1_i20.p1  ORF type:complete len:275 (-),score=18.99 TRINITY_DN8187_c0_g1_i20:408-1232(-)
MDRTQKSKKGGKKMTINEDFAKIEGKSCLILASKQGQNEIVQQLLKMIPNIDINSTSNDGSTPLILACEAGNIDIFEKLMICQDININHARDDGATCLYLAIKYKFNFIAKTLLNHKQINVNCNTTEGWGCLHAACESGQRDIIESLLKFNVDINKCTRDGSTPLIIAVKFGNTYILDLLLDNPQINVNRQDINGRSALHWAVLLNHPLIFHALISFEGIITNLKDKQGLMPILYACIQGYTKYIKLLQSDLISFIQESVIRKQKRDDSTRDCL